MLQLNEDERRRLMEACRPVLGRGESITRRTQALLAAAGEFGPEARWYALQVERHAENAVDSLLWDVGIEHWLPMKKVKPPRRGGRGKDDRPTYERLAFPGYVFVRVMPMADAFAGLRLLKGVTGIVSDASGPVHVPDRILLEWRAFLQRDPETEAFWLRVGQMVRINSGPFATYNGFVADLSDAQRLGRLIVEVMIFGQMAPVQLGLDQIEV